MTAACGGGASGPKTGAAAVVDFTAGALGALLSKYPTPWAIPAIGLVSLAPLTLSTFCASDPPAVPTFTQAEVNAVLQLTFGTDFDNGLSKFRDWLYNAIWYDQCQCNSGALVPLSPPAQPSNSITPVFPSPAVAAPCDTYVAHPIPGIAQPDNTSITGTLIAKFNDAAGNLLTYSLSVASGAAQVTRDVPLPIGASWNNLRFEWSPTNGFTIGGPALVPGVTSVRFQLVLNDNLTAHTWEPWMDITQYCNGQIPGASQTPCCPPDAATSAILNTLLDLVQSMQRNYAPFGYTLGTAHAALTGVGSFAVSRVLGMKVAVTAYPPTNQVLGGNPSYVKDLGWVSFSDGDGMIQERRLSQLGFTWFPQVAPLATQFNYFLNPGVTISATPLLPEA